MKKGIYYMVTSPNSKRTSCDTFNQIKPIYFRYQMFTIIFARDVRIHNYGHRSSDGVVLGHNYHKEWILDHLDLLSFCGMIYVTGMDREAWRGPKIVSR